MINPSFISQLMSLARSQFRLTLGCMMNMEKEMDDKSKSNKVKCFSQLFPYSREFTFSLLKDICGEFGALFSVLEDDRHFDGAGPVGIVEALTEDELLKCLLLQLAIPVDDAVMAGDG
jgi:hypothetical protein